jgi:sortase A
MAWRGVAAGVGRVLVGLGVLILLFVAYQLWGTRLSESHSQDVLRHQLASPLRSSAGTEPAQAPVNPNATPPQEGRAVGLIRIPKIGVDKAIVEGTGTSDLRQGPGHYGGTPLPGQPGNAAIAGHRTTYGAPFSDLNQLGPGDRVLVTTPQGTFRYDVVRSLVVAPSEVSVIAPTPINQLTLTTCTPRYSASQRLIVQATLVGTPAAEGPKLVRPRPGALAGDTGAWLPAIAWGLAASAVAAIVLVVAHLQRRRWPVYLVGTAAFLAALFLFFAAISRLLPASV